MSQRKRLEELIPAYSDEKLGQFFREAHPDYQPSPTNLNQYVENDPDLIIEINTLGKIDFEDGKRMLIVSAHMNGGITEKRSKKKQFDMGWKILKDNFCDAGIFVFHDTSDTSVSV